MLLIQVLRYVLRRFYSPELFFSQSEPPATNEQILSVRDSGPKVTIIIPTRDRVDLLKRCIGSVRSITLYANYEVLVVNNGSVEPETLSYLRELNQIGITSIDFPGEFNFAAICNFATREASGQVLCFLNNDALIVQPEWLDWLVSKALWVNAGVVGPVLLENEHLISDAGIALGHRGIAGSMLRGQILSDPIVSGTLARDRPVSAISFACAVVSKQKYLDVGGMDETFAVGLNDVDFGMRSLAEGWTNYVVSSSRVIHKGYGSRNRMTDFKGGFRAAKEVLRFLRKYRLFSFRDGFAVRG
ncbi:COG1216 Predicted glycosyltransferases [Microbacteriaceae bacterium]